MKLAQMVDVVENNKSCVILKVKDNQFMNLIMLGCFDGDETMFRVTKGRNHTYTVWHGKDNKSYSWEFGDSGYTLVSESMDKKRKLLTYTIEQDFNINLE